MSGRVRTTLSDGRRVTGYRKTLARRAPRTALRPKLILSFTLPDLTRELIEIAGYDRQYLFDQMTTTLRRLAMYPVRNPIAIDIRRADEPPAKWRSKSRPFQIVWNGRHATMIQGGVMRPLSETYAQSKNRWPPTRQSEQAHD